MHIDKHSIKKTLGLLLLPLFLLLSSVSPVQAVVTVTYYHTDALGSVVAASDESGNPLWSESYRPYGERQEGFITTDENALFYTGKPHDDDTGLSYFGARYYNPSIGRFMGVDPAGFQDSNVHSFNKYAYANNNPYKFVDPDGELPILLLAFVAYDFYSSYQETGNIGDSAKAAALGLINPFKKLKTTANIVKKFKRTKKTGLPKSPTGKGSVSPNQRDPKRVLTKNEKGDLLNKRGGKCEGCGKDIGVDDARGHHIKRHADGGQTTSKNTAILCDPCHKNIHKK